MLRTSCQAPRTIAFAARFRGAFFSDARNACEMRTSRARRRRVARRKKNDSRRAREPRRRRNRVDVGRKVERKFFLYDCAESALQRPECDSNRANRSTTDSRTRRFGQPTRRSSRPKMRIARPVKRPSSVNSRLARAPDAPTRASRASTRARRALTRGAGGRTRRIRLRFSPFDVVGTVRSSSKPHPRGVEPAPQPSPAARSCADGLESRHRGAVSTENHSIPSLAFS